MDPPEIAKTVDRPKVKKNREPDKASKRKGEWSYSRKGTVMTCNKCGGENHNSRTCFKSKDGEEGATTTLSTEDDWLGFEFETEAQT